MVGFQLGLASSEITDLRAELGKQEYQQLYIGAICPQNV